MKNLFDRFKTIIYSDISQGENIDAYVAILIGIVLALLDIFNVVDVEVIGPTILLVMTYLVITSLVSRRTIKSLEELINSKNDKSNLFGLYDYSADRQAAYLRNAKTIDLMAINLYRFIPGFYLDILHALNNGATLRILLIDPDSPAMKYAAFRSDLVFAKDTIAHRAKTTIDIIEKLNEGLTKGKIELRFMDFMPPYGISIFDPKTEEKPFCLVRIYTFRKAAKESPTIIPDPDKDLYWFNFFRNEFETIWNEANKAELG